MKEKIIKAIDRGLMNILSTDIEVQDINFNHDNIDNTCVLPYEYRTVDMGTGILWCEYNLGAYPGDNASEWYGNYYAWGETEIKDDYSWKNYKHCDETKDTMTKYNRIDNLRTLTLENDVANKVLGRSFRIPTQEEFQKLTDSTTNEYIKNYNGINMLNGILFTAENGNTLFFPAAGYCKETMRYAAGKTGGVWSSTLDYYKFNNGFNLGVYTDGAYLKGGTYRSYGLPVRGIKYN